jgi:hypothetical protein
MDFVGLLVDENKKRKKFLSCLSLSRRGICHRFYLRAWRASLDFFLLSLAAGDGRVDKEKTAHSLSLLSSLSSLFEEEEEEEEES